MVVLILKYSNFMRAISLSHNDIIKSLFALNYRKWMCLYLLTILSIEPWQGCHWDR